MKVVVTICRLLVGLLFIFSGLIKANDPLGFSYKLDEYFEIFHMAFLNPFTVYMAMFICIFEIVLGVMVLLGSYMRAATWLLLLMIIFFTFLTGYSAISGKVTECGCFGDAIKLKPWESFWKDIVLTALILVLFFCRDRIKPLFDKRVNDALLGIATLATTAFTVYCYMYLPVKDFRPYRVGNDIRAQMTVPPDAPKDSVITTLVYKDKTSGQEQPYTMENLPWQDSVWMNNHEFVRQQLKVVREGAKPAITDFRVWDVNQKDITLKVLDSPGYKIWVVAYDLTKTNTKAFEKIVRLANDAEKNNISVYGLTASPYEVNDPFRHEVNAAFPFYYSDNTVLKTIVRSNPGIVLLDGSKVIGMWHHNATPDIEEVLNRTRNYAKR
jgi:uncharacterized membrane protein YphA (DoxX/SURF4 family)